MNEAFAYHSGVPYRPYHRRTIACEMHDRLETLVVVGHCHAELIVVKAPCGRIHPAPNLHAVKQGDEIHHGLADHVGPQVRVAGVYVGKFVIDQHETVIDVVVITAFSPLDRLQGLLPLEHDVDNLCEMVIGQHVDALEQPLGDDGVINVIEAAVAVIA